MPICGLCGYEFQETCGRYEDAARCMKQKREHKKRMTPFYIRQAALSDLSETKEAWADAAFKEAKEEGAVWCRVSVDGGLILVEGWRERPLNEGEPRWQLCAT